MIANGSGAAPRVGDRHTSASTALITGAGSGLGEGGPLGTGRADAHRDTAMAAFA